MEMKAESRGTRFAPRKGVSRLSRLRAGILYTLPKISVRSIDAVLLHFIDIRKSPGLKKFNALALDRL